MPKQQSQAKKNSRKQGRAKTKGEAYRAKHGGVGHKIEGSKRDRGRTPYALYVPVLKAQMAEEAAESKKKGG